MKKAESLVRYFARNIGIVIGLVLIWRGMWILLDGIDRFFFGGDHILTAFGGIVVGLLILYLPDKDLKEIQKL
jgi:putative flippase GtrA